MPQNKKIIRIGISSCLLGEKVRYDGGHKFDRQLTELFGRYFEWVPVCPEVELGLGMPRETMRLEQTEEGVRLLTTESRRDFTEPMWKFAAVRVSKLAEADVQGYILKSNSPSCGYMHVQVFGPGRRLFRTGRGLFAEALAERFPGLPIEEEGRLCNPDLRENWIERVFAYRRIQSFWRRVESAQPD